MNLKHIFTAILAGAQFAFFIPAMASPTMNYEIQDVIGHHTIERGESREEAIEAARRDAFRTATERAGVVVNSNTTTLNGMVTEDLIKLRSANVVEVVDAYTTEGKNADGTRYLDYIAKIKTSVPNLKIYSLTDVPAAYMNDKDYIVLSDAELRKREGVQLKSVKYDTDTRVFSFVDIVDLSKHTWQFEDEVAPKTGMAICRYEIDNNTRMILMRSVSYKNPETHKFQRRVLEYKRFIVPGSEDNDRWLTACLQKKILPDEYFEQPDWRHIPETDLYMDVTNSFQTKDGALKVLLLAVNDNDKFSAVSYPIAALLIQGKLYATDPRKCNDAKEWGSIGYSRWTPQVAKQITHFAQRFQYKTLW